MTAKAERPLIEENELRRCAMSGLIRGLSAQARLTSRCLNWAQRLEGGQFYSGTARDIMRLRLGVSIGAYSYGGCFVPRALPAGTRVGRYVSMADGIKAFVRNHPSDRLSMHPFFYNSALEFVDEDTIATGDLEIGHDAWIGERAIITPGCSRIGLGAVVGAGSVVTRDVPDFAVVVGSPARVVRTRFSVDVCELIRASRWWERPVSDCRAVMADMIRPLGPGAAAHPLLQSVKNAANGPMRRS